MKILRDDCALSRKLNLMTFLKKKKKFNFYTYSWIFFRNFFSRDHTARLWNVIERRCLKIIQHTVDVRSVFFNTFAIFTGEENSGADSSGLNFVIKKLCYNFPHYMQMHHILAHSWTLIVNTCYNSCLLFASCHLELVISKNSWFFARYFNK